MWKFWTAGVEMRSGSSMCSFSMTTSKGRRFFSPRIDYFRFRCDLGLLFLLVRNSFFDLLPFFIGHSNINFMGGGAVPNRQGITLAGNRLAGQVRGYRFPPVSRPFLCG